MDGGLIKALLTVTPAFLAEAERRWQTNPRCSKAEPPAPPPETTATPTQQAQSSQVKPLNNQ